MRVTHRLVITLALAATSAAQTAEERPAPRALELQPALEQWKSDHGGSWRVHVDRATGHAQMLFGGGAEALFQPSADSEQDWFDAARNWIARTEKMFGISSSELVQERFVFLPLGMAAGTDKVTVSFRQVVLGLPVEGARVNVLFNTRGTLLSIHSTAAPDTDRLEVAPAISARTALGAALSSFEARTGVPALERGLPLLVFAQVERNEVREAVLAYQIDLLNEFEPVGFTYTVDARTGEVLRQDALVHNLDVTGTVTSWATPGTEADHSGNPEAEMPMSYINVQSSAGTVQTDRDGNFNFAGVNTPLDITVTYNGTFNNVNNEAGSDYSVTFNNVQPNQANTLVMNPLKTQQITAQANAYQQLNAVRDYIRDTVPSDATADFNATSNPNISSTCNAFFNGNSVNYYLSGGSCNNTAFTSVVAHEYGHWLNVLYNTGNGSDGMGEGNADVWGMYTYDDHIVGRYFFTDGGFVRTGLNTRQYCGDGNGGCYGGVHADGEVWMGAAWKARRNLKNDLGTALGGATANSLFVGWMNAYNQSNIHSIIETQWLTLDDDDADIGNGTPNYPAINDGFLEQGFPGVDLDLIQFSNVTDLPDVDADAGPYDVNADILALQSPPIVNAALHYQFNGGGYNQVPMANTGGNGYTAQVPALGGNGFVEYYLSATDSNNNTEEYPDGGASAPLDFVIGVEQTLISWDFEAAGNEGWVGGIAGDDATTGEWTRGDPIATAAQPGDDHTPGAGNVNCWFTGQGSNGGSLGENDVDGGTTTLMSPIVDMTGLSGVKVNYWRWYSNDTGASPNADTFVIQVSNNGGSTWTTAEIVGPTGQQASGGWFEASILVDTILAPSSQMQFRFLASDLGSGSIVEAALDDMEITFLEGGCAPPTNYCVGSPNSTGFGAVMSVIGSQDVNDNDFTLIASALPTNTFGLFIYGMQQAQVPVGDGFLCIGGFIVRLPVQQSDMLGQMIYDLDFTNLPPAGPISNGDTINIQAWYRDAGFGAFGYNFSDAISVPFCD